MGLAADVHSSALLLTLDGVLPGPRPAATPFVADTGWEPADVYAPLEYLERAVRRIPVHMVRAANNLRHQMLDQAASGVASPPLYVYNRRGC